MNSPFILDGLVALLCGIAANAAEVQALLPVLEEGPGSYDLLATIQRQRVGAPPRPLRHQARSLPFLLLIMSAGYT